MLIHRYKMLHFPSNVNVFKSFVMLPLTSVHYGTRCPPKHGFFHKVSSVIIKGVGGGWGVIYNDILWLIKGYTN